MSFFNGAINAIRDAFSTNDEIKLRQNISEACMTLKLGSIVVSIVAVALGILIGGAAGFLIAAMFCIPAHDAYFTADSLQKIMDDGCEDIKAMAKKHFKGDLAFIKHITNRTLVAQVILIHILRNHSR